MNLYLTIALASVFLFSACAKQGSAGEEQPLVSQPTIQPADTQCIALAQYTDTIVYTVSILPKDPTDEVEIENLSRLHRKTLVDNLFASIYAGCASVEDFGSGAQLTIDDVKTREIEDARFAREKVAALQFTEAWHFDPQTCCFAKRVISTHIAYDVRNDDGSFVAYRAGYIIRPKQ